MDLKYEKLKGKKYAIHITSIDEANAVNDIIDYCDGTYGVYIFKRYAEETVWHLEDNCFSSFQYAVDHGYRIILAKDFINANIPVEPQRAYLLSYRDSYSREENRYKLVYASSEVKAIETLKEIITKIKFGDFGSYNEITYVSCETII